MIGNSAKNAYNFQFPVSNFSPPLPTFARPKTGIRPETDGLLFHPLPQHQAMTGSAITIKRGKLKVPNDPIIPFIEGDGTGPDIWAASVRVFDAAVEKAYGGKRKIVWREVLAGEKAFNKTGNWLPDETLKVIDEYKVAIKGPLTTPLAAASARSTWPCASNSTSTPACAPYAGSKALLLPCSNRKKYT